MKQRVLVGEPEGMFPQVAQKLAAGEDLPFLIHVDDLGLDGYDDGWCTVLDALPFPAWDLVPVERYRFLSIMGSRGCDQKCAYCPYVSAQGCSFRGRSPNSIVAELSWLAENYAPARVVFRDPVFAHDAARVTAICDWIARHPEIGAGTRFSWECESRPDHFDGPMLARMKQAGCGWIKIGLESVDLR